MIISRRNPIVQPRRIVTGDRGERSHASDGLKALDWLTVSIEVKRMKPAG
jgi:hypothetical protein